MALKKKVTKRRTDAEYFVITKFRWDSESKESSAIVTLFVDKEHREACRRKEDESVIPIAAKIRLNGEDFDSYVPPGSNLIKGFYKAARDGVGVVSDFGKEAFTNAEDV